LDIIKKYGPYEEIECWLRDGLLTEAE